MRRTATEDTLTFTQVTPAISPLLIVSGSHFTRRDKEDLDAGHLHRPGYQPSEAHLLPHTPLVKVRFLAGSDSAEYNRDDELQALQ